MKTLKITDQLYMNMLPVSIPKETEVNIKDDAPTNQYLIIDRSGSMCGYLDDIIDYATEYCEKLPEGSTVSVGYFSSNNEYNLSMPYTLRKEVDGVKTTLNSYRRALGLTNFIQILEKVGESASKVNAKSSLFFFTDGCHNSGGGKKEIEKALLEWKKYAQVSMFVGYGYIDRDTMSWMANVTEGSFVHLDNFGNVKSTLSDFGSAVEDSSPVIPVDFIVDEDTTPISITGKAIVEYIVDKKKVYFKPSKKGFKGLYFLTSKKPSGAEELTTMDATAEKGIRALATMYSQRNNTQISLELLNYLGDKFLIQKFYNAITPDEFSSAEEITRKSVFSTKERFIEGQVKNFIPAPDAFCVVDAINILAADEDVVMYVRDKDFEYNRIGSKVNQVDGPFVEYPDDLSVSFNSIVMNKERLNMSISTNTTGVLKLDPSKFTKTSFTVQDLAKYGIPENYPITSYKNYTIIADGRLQTKKIVVSNLAKDTIKKLGPIITKRADGRYVVDFTTLPIINRTYVKMTSAKTLAQLVWAEKELSDELSVLNWFKKTAEEATGKIVTKDKSLSEEAAKFLWECCYIKNGSYSPPVESVAAEDEYQAYSFSVDIKGYSKASPGEVIKKAQAGKAPTAREELVAAAYQCYHKTAGITDPNKVAEMIVELNKKLIPIRKNIQLSKMAIILGNRGKMDEFESREDMQLSLDIDSFILNRKLNLTFNFNIEQITVKL